MSRNERTPGTPPDDHACACSDRRAFLQKTAGALAGTLAVLGLDGRASAMPVSFGAATGRSADEFTYPIPGTDGATIDRANQIILVRFQGQVMAFNLSCPHQNAAVRWRPADQRFECTRHDSQYRPDGAYIGGRATRNMDRFAIRRSGDTVIVDVSRMYESDQQRAEWAGATVKIAAP